MNTVIYGDIYFIVNLSMDFTALFVCSRILRLDMSNLRALVAASIGSLYAICALFIEDLPVIPGVLAVIMPFLMCHVALCERRISRLILETAVFFGVSFLMGGIVSALYMLLNKYLIGREVSVGGRPDILYSDLPLPLLFVSAVLSAAVSAAFGSFTKRMAMKKTRRVTIKNMGRCAKFEAMCDSGNLLREPIGGLPVILVNERVSRELFDEGVLDAILSSDTDILKVCERPSRIRIVPVSTVGSTRMAMGYIPDRITVDNTERRACIMPTSEKDFDGYDGIIPLELMDM